MMENSKNEENLDQQHPKPSDDIHLNIETVTPDTENEQPDSDRKLQEAPKDSSRTGPEDEHPQNDATTRVDETEDQAQNIQHYEGAKHEPLPGQGTSDNSPDDKPGDPGDDIETVSP